MYISVCFGIISVCLFLNQKTEPEYNSVFCSVFGSFFFLWFLVFSGLSAHPYWQSKRLSLLWLRSLSYIVSVLWLLDELSLASSVIVYSSWRCAHLAHCCTWTEQSRNWHWFGMSILSLIVSCVCGLSDHHILSQIVEDCVCVAIGRIPSIIWIMGLVIIRVIS